MVCGRRAAALPPGRPGRRGASVHPLPPLLSSATIFRTGLPQLGCTSLTPRCLGICACRPLEPRGALSSYNCAVKGIRTFQVISTHGEACGPCEKGPVWPLSAPVLRPEPSEPFHWWRERKTGVCILEVGDRANVLPSPLPLHPLIDTPTGIWRFPEESQYRVPAGPCWVGGGDSRGTFKFEELVLLSARARVWEPEGPACSVPSPLRDHRRVPHGGFYCHLERDSGVRGGYLRLVSLRGFDSGDPSRDMKTLFPGSPFVLVLLPPHLTVQIAKLTARPSSNRLILSVLELFRNECLFPVNSYLSPLRSGTLFS